MFLEQLETVVDKLDPVPLARVPPAHLDVGGRRYGVAVDRVDGHQLRPRLHSLHCEGDGDTRVDAPTVKTRLSSLAHFVGGTAAGAGRCRAGFGGRPSLGLLLLLVSAGCARHELGC